MREGYKVINLIFVKSPLTIITTNFDFLNEVINYSFSSYDYNPKAMIGVVGKWKIKYKKI